MGKTIYPDTNNQFAYRTNRDAFLSGITFRAEMLWIDGYRVSLFDNTCEPNTFLVYREDADAGYKVNPVEKTCSCRFFTDQYQNPLDPDNPSFLLPCKHLQRFHDLVTEQISHWLMRYNVAKQTAGPRNSSAERAENYFLIWNALSLAWGEAEEAILDKADDVSEWLSK